MALDFELTISGLCVIVLKSKDEYPTKPVAVDILCPTAPGHKPRLNYQPDGVITDVETELFIDPQGIRTASLDLTGRVLRLAFGQTPANFSLDWGSKLEEPPADNPDSEKWMWWVPSAQDLGLKGIWLAPLGKLPAGADARLTLRPGEIIARKVVKEKRVKEKAMKAYIKWKFPANGATRAVANEVVYRASDVKTVKVQWGAGGPGESLSVEREGKLEMSISNDLTVVTKHYNDDHGMLDHLSHIEVLAEPRLPVQVPVKAAAQFTGRPICNQIFFVDTSD